MSFCQTCGSTLPDKGTVCPACGATQGVAMPGAVPSAGAAPAAMPNAMSSPMPAAGAGLSPNVAGALTYLLGLVTGVLFLVIDPFKNDRFVRFHAFQSIFFNVAWIAFWIVWSIIGVMLSTISHGLFLLVQIPVNLVVFLGGLCLWLFLMFSAYQGKTFQLPIVGPMAAKQAGI